MAGANCANGCCPALPEGETEGQLNGDSAHFIFTLDTASPQRIQIEADGDRCPGFMLWRYRSDGYAQRMGSSSRCEPIDDPLLPAGRYGVTVGGRGAYRLIRSSRFEPLLEGLGSVEVGGDDGSLGIPFRLAERTSISFRTQERIGDCEEAWSVGLFSVDGYQIWGDEGRPCVDLEGSGAAVLAAGDYVFVMRARELNASYQFTLSNATEGEWSAGQADIDQPGTYPQPRINSSERAAFRVTFPAGGLPRRGLRTYSMISAYGSTNRPSYPRTYTV
jgi:hypothetical protein